MTRREADHYVPRFFLERFSERRHESLSVLEPAERAESLIILLRSLLNPDLYDPVPTVLSPSPAPMPAWLRDAPAGIFAAWVQENF